MANIVNKPWGNYLVIEKSNPNEVHKILTIKAGESISLQKHMYRDEYWTVIQGSCIIRIEDNLLSAVPGQSFVIRKNEWHRIEALTCTVIYEVQVGEILSEDDIIRAEDKYGRARKIVAISGGFDPLHAGHIEYIKKASELGDVLVCILNQDKFLINKKGYVFMPFEERKAVLESIKYIDYVIGCIDSDQTVCKTLEYVRPHIFAKGGDRNINNIPEYETCKRLGIEIVDGLGNKIQSSSKLVNNIRGEMKCLNVKT